MSHKSTMPLAVEAGRVQFMDGDHERHRVVRTKADRRGKSSKAVPYAPSTNLQCPEGVGLRVDQ